MNLDRIIREVPVEDKKRWDDVITHPLQSWAWGEFRNLMGVRVIRLGMYHHDTLINGWQITFHRIPFLPYTIGYCPKGHAPVRELIPVLRVIGKKHHAIFVQMEPDLLAEEKLDKECERVLRPSHRPLFTKYTFVLDISKNENDLLSSFHQKTRYNIRLAQKHGVTIREDSSENAFTAYLKLSSETTKRQQFYAHNTLYHKTLWSVLKKAGIAHLFTASFKSEIIAAWLVFVWKETVYYPYGASSRRFREVMAPNLMLWEIVRWAKNNKIYYFDLWGALGPNPDPHDPWYGFHRFKEGYRPDLVESIGSFDFVIHKSLYKLYCIADSVRWNLLKLKAKI